MRHPRSRRPIFRALLITSLLVTLVAPAAHAHGRVAPPAEPDQMLDAAEAAYVEGSYGRALELYTALADMDLDAETARWVAYRKGDTGWRRLARTRQPDQTPVNFARQELQQLVDAIKHTEDRDRVWALAHASLADSWWIPQWSRNWGAAWSHYEAALDWWSGARDIESARHEYLQIVWRMARPPQPRGQHWWGWQQVPQQVLENARRIARTPDDQARAHVLLGLHYSHNAYDWFRRQRVEREFEAAIEFGRGNPWYDDAIFHYANWLANNGRVIVDENGGWSSQQDYVEAVALYRRLMDEYAEGETLYWRQARDQIKNITGVQLGASAHTAFLPGSKIQLGVSWRNLRAIELQLYPVDLTRHVDPTRESRGVGEWIQHIDVSRLDPVRTWSYETSDTGEHRPGSDTITLDEPLAVGAYVLVATAGGKKVRDIVLVSDVLVIAKEDPSQLVTWVTDAKTSAPIANAEVKVWSYRYDKKKRWTGSTTSGRTGADGLAIFDDAPRANDHGQQLVTVAAGDRQAFTIINYGWNRQTSERWKIYATTDRPAYRPDETVFWKCTARTNDGSGYRTPNGATVAYEIGGPRGTIQKGEIELNAFGSAWGEVELEASMPLGEYWIVFKTKERGQVGRANLFRLEEYKLPEYEVTVELPKDEDDKPLPVRLGETVDVTIDASYYFGGPVANANVQVLVYQRPFHSYWQQPRLYTWCYEQPRPYWYHYGQGQVVVQTTLTTDDTGRAILALDTTSAGANDTEFTVEARVTDASRREITGRGTVRATRQAYYVHPRAKHNLHEPGDLVEVDFTVIDANSQPVETTGQIIVTRDTWREVWIDPRGREHTGRSFSAICDDLSIGKPGWGWRRIFAGYRSEEILRETISTNADGKATFGFTPEKIGFYRIRWQSRDEGNVPISAQTSVWVTDDKTGYLGYQHQGIQIIVDKDTFRVGDTAPVMISTERTNRHALFTIEGALMHHVEVVHVKDAVRLVQVPITEAMLPNVTLAAMSVQDGQLVQAQQAITIPPVEQYLTVDVELDRTGYGPREEGTMTVRTTDVDGKPVQTEVTLSLVDASVFAIQSDYAGDPRPFFFNDRQPHRVAASSTLNYKQYAMLTEDAKDSDEQRAEALRRDYGTVSGPVPRASGDYLMNSAAEGFAKRSRKSMATGRMAPSAAPMEMAEREAGADDWSGGAGVGGGGGEIEVVVRSDFSSTLLWHPDVITGKDGTATVPVVFNDALTKWKGTARAASTGNQVGIGEVAVRTRQPLIARLQGPRFFVVGDSVTLSGVFNNNTEEAMMIVPQLEADGLTVTGMAHGDHAMREAGVIQVPAGGMARIDWTAFVETAGTAKLKLIGRGEQHADAMEKSFPVVEHGIERLLVKAGAVRGDAVSVRLDVPAARREGSTTFTVQVTPSIAVTMLDALPYLVDYPYGCTEQTMSRFMPAVVTAKTLSELGLEPEDVLDRAFGGVDRDLRNEKDPKGEQQRENLAKLDEIVRAGLNRLADFQHGDGGWGWWKTGDSDHFMTAYVLFGLSMARDADVAVDQGSMQRAASFLDKRLVEETLQADMQAWLLHALAAHAANGDRPAKPTKLQRKAIDTLWSNRDQLNAYTRSLFALSLHAYGDEERAQILVRNLENDVIRDDAPDESILVSANGQANPARMGTAHWGQSGVYYRWSRGGVEATSFALRAMLAIDPENKLIEPVMNWLVKNRRGTQWNSTRDTAVTVLAMNDYLRTSGELARDIAYELRVNGKMIASPTIAAADILDAPSTFEVDEAILRDGENVIEIVRRDGNGPLYFSAMCEFFSLEEPIPAGGNELFLNRAYASLSARETLLKGFVYDRNELPDGGYVTSGDRVEVILTIEAKNDLEYVVLEDLKPAGLEAVQLTSGGNVYARELKSSAVDRRFGPDGEPDGSVRVPGVRSREDYTGRQRQLHQELRDRKVALFIDKLPEGIWEIRYDMRAEIPGEFHALPLMGHAMYVPEIRGNSAEVRMTVGERSE